MKKKILGLFLCVFFIPAILIAALLINEVQYWALHHDHTGKVITATDCGEAPNGNKWQRYGILTNFNANRMGVVDLCDLFTVGDTVLVSEHRFFTLRTVWPTRLSQILRAAYYHYFAFSMMLVFAALGWLGVRILRNLRAAV